MSSHNNVLYASPLTTVGSFDCPVTAPDFGNTGPAPDYLMAFPRTAVTIRHASMRAPIVADPNTVTLYNRGQEYERGQVSDYGDRCDWIAFAPEAVAEAMADRGVTRPGDPVRLFTTAYGRSSPRVYAAVRRLVVYLRSSPVPDGVAVEELSLALLRRVLEQALPARTGRGRSRRAATSSRHRRLVQRVCELLATRYAEPVTLQSIADAAHVSPHHLSRVFRDTTGMTMFQYLRQLRLRSALEPLEQKTTDLAAVGMSVGFCDHSHFTKHFRRAFAVPPSTFRHELSAPVPPRV
ncbi:MAG: AraC family transcriptional regulator [Pseudomonadota bacterium]